MPSLQNSPSKARTGLSALAACLALGHIAACVGSMDEAPVSPEVPAFEDVGRVVTIGDNIGSNPTWASSYIALLHDNDDALFPEFAGLDLDSTLTSVELVRLDRGGDSYTTLAAIADPWCTCTGSACSEVSCIDTSSTTPTMVMVQLGMNDLVGLALRMLSDPSARDDPQQAIDDFAVAVNAVLDRVEEDIATPPLLVVANIYDPADGVGDFADLITTFFPFDGAELVTEELALMIISGFNEAVEAVAEDRGAVLIDMHTHFLGHGYHYDEEGIAVVDDTSIWFQTVVDPNLRGAHEIRRLVWNALSDQPVHELPGDLPATTILGLPAVPAEGWSNAVVDASITPELSNGTINVAADPDEALGAPDSTLIGGIVAIGVTGAWLTVDLGEGEVATDGEGEDLVVLELGPLSGGTPEPYRVSVATDPEGPFTIVGDALGERAFDLADVGVSAARYVRVESLVQEIDVLNGLGSPSFPGPEIDAIGAVYPGDSR